MVHNKLLIPTVDIITEPLTILFNRCLNEGIFPNIWKIAHVTPLRKKGPENLCNNYRPISLLSYPSLINRTVSVDVKHHVYFTVKLCRQGLRTMCS